MAQSIIDERTKNGAFASVDDLMRVSGIGEKKLCQNQRLRLRMSSAEREHVDASAAPDAVDDGPVRRHVHELRLGAQRGR